MPPIEDRTIQLSHSDPNGVGNTSNQINHMRRAGLLGHTTGDVHGHPIHVKTKCMTVI